MTNLQRLEKVRSQFRDWYIDGSKELAAETKSLTHGSLLAESNDLLSQIESMAKNNFDHNNFELAFKRWVNIWMYVFKERAQHLYKENPNIDMSSKLFRFLDPEQMRISLEFLGDTIYITPSETKIDGAVNYTASEIEELNRLQLGQDNLKAIHEAKKILGGTIMTDFDFATTFKQVEDKNERNRIFDANSRVNSSPTEYWVHIPLEEYQLLVARTA